MVPNRQNLLDLLLEVRFEQVYDQWEACSTYQTKELLKLPWDMAAAAHPL